MVFARPARSEPDAAALDNTEGAHANLRRKAIRHA